MSKYDPDKDVEIWSDSLATSERSKFHVSVMRYDNGPLKVSFHRTFIDASQNEKPASAGRLTEGEVRWLSDVFPDIIEQHFGG